MDNNLIPVTLEETCDYLGFDISDIEDDPMVKRNIIRLIKFSNTYLKGAIGENYPIEDERAKQIALLVIGDLYEARELTSKNITATTRKILNDLEMQLKLEMKQNGNG